MQDIWLMLAAMAVLMSCCAMGAYCVARRCGFSAGVLLAGLITALMLVFAQYLSDSVWVAQIVPARILPVFGNWLPPLAAMLAGAGWVISRRPPWTRIVTLGFLIGCALYLPYRSLFAERPAARDVWLGSLCLQTTDATCGAAAAATLLNSVGIATNEHEMTNLCYTTWRGTSLHGVVSGLAKKTEGTPWRVRVMKMDVEALEQLGRPAILRVGLDDYASTSTRYVRQGGWMPGVAHMVVLSEVTADRRLRIADPSTGWETWQPEALNVLWQGVAIVLEPRDSSPPPEYVLR